jgi:hypothetical protein
VATVFQNDRRETSSTSLESIIIEQSSFDYGEMIVDIGKTYKKKKEHIALSCLNRKEAAVHISNDIRTERKRLFALANQMHTFYERKDRVAFSTHYPKSRGLFSNLLPKLLQIRSLHPLPDNEMAIQVLSSLEREADHLISSMKIGITPVVGSDVKDTTTRINNDLSKIIERYHVVATPSTKNCTEEQTHTMFVTIDTDCSTIMGNHVCLIETSLSLVDCTAQTTDVVPLKGTFRGANSRFKQKAIEEAIQKISIGENQDQIERLLKKNAPLE